MTDEELQQQFDQSRIDVIDERLRTENLDTEQQAALRRNQALIRQEAIHRRRSQSSRVTLGDRRPSDGRHNYRTNGGGRGYGQKIGTADTRPGQRVEAITDSHGRVSLNTPAALAKRGLPVNQKPLDAGRCRGYINGQLWTCREVVQEVEQSIIMVGTGEPSITQGGGLGRFWAIASFAAATQEWVEGTLPDWTEATAVYPLQDNIEAGLFVLIPNLLTGGVRGIAAKPGVTLAISDASPHDLINVGIRLNETQRSLPLVYSEDDGQTWENPKIENTAFARALADGFAFVVADWDIKAIAQIDERFYMVGNYQQIHVSDDGLNWVSQYGAFASLDFAGLAGFELIAGEGDRIVLIGFIFVLSTDRGQTWQQTSGAPGSYRQLLLFDGRYYAFGSSETVFPYLIVSDDGEGWSGVSLSSLLPADGRGLFIDGAIGAGFVVALAVPVNAVNERLIAFVELTDVANAGQWRLADNPFTGENERPTKIKFITTLGQFLLISNLGAFALFSNPEQITVAESPQELRSPLTIYEAFL